MNFTINKNPKKLNKIVCYQHREEMYLLLDLSKEKYLLLETKEEKKVWKKFYKMFCFGITQISTKTVQKNYD